MPTQLLRTLSLALACAAAGCVKAYEPPALNEPHALLKLRRVYHALPGTERETRIFIDDALWLDEYALNRPAPPGASATRLSPGAVRVTVGSTFWHMELRWVSETYTESVPYTETETYTVPASSSCSRGMMACSLTETRTRTVTKYRSEIKTRWVWKPVKVIDDDCQRFAERAFDRDHVYALQYTYFGLNRCSVTCLEQYPSDTPEGSSFRPCRVPP